MNSWIANNHHNVGIGRKGINEGGKPRISYLHTLKLGLRLATT